MHEWFIFFAVLVVSIVLVGYFRSYAIRKNLLDTPSERSSHDTLTPRGGGVVIVLVFCGMGSGLFLANMLPPPLFWTIVIGGGMVAAIGFWDDHGHIPARWRFFIHVISSIWAVWWLGGIDVIQLGWWSINIGIWGVPIVVLMTVWLLNLYNFMDGIDGIAGVEAICVSVGAAIILMLSGHSDYAVWLGILAASSAGFLAWNWPPARIFMGDVGSGFLGYVFAVFMLASLIEDERLLWSWLILLGVFVVDASVTLFVRIWQGKKWYIAHKSHAYQRASRRYGSHFKVSVGVLIVNVVWLFPLAYYASLEAGLGVFFMLLAYFPLFIIAMAYGAGKESS